MTNSLNFMKEYKIDKKLANIISKLLHPNQLKHLATHKKDYEKFLVIEDNNAKIVVRAEDPQTGEIKDMYDVYSIELQKIIQILDDKKIKK